MIVLTFGSGAVAQAEEPYYTDEVGMRLFNPFPNNVGRSNRP